MTTYPSIDPPSIDPLAAFMEGAVEAGSRRPIPHVSTTFDVELRAGLAAVEVSRVFRNDENRTIEAILTFPVPVRAQVYALEAVIDGRRLVGEAKSKQAARQSYEAAIDQGKAAVLHEETLRGVHTLSVAHVAPGAQIEVRCRYVEALSRVGETLSLRIPTTVGDIYGRSPLAEPDHLVTGGPVLGAQLTVRAARPVKDRLGRVLDTVVTVPLDRPIDLSMAAEASETAQGVTARGERFALTATPRPDGGEPLRLAILVDRSGSMGSISYLEDGLSKHQSVVKALSGAAADMGAADSVRLWQFDDQCDLVFAGPARDLAAAASQLAPPSGGTEIGGALRKVLVDREVHDVLLITDGKSYAIDVQALAGEGRRISVLLVGEDSLEANVGHLAALTGGEVMVCGAADLGAQLMGVIGRLRSQPAGEARADGAFDLGGMIFRQAASDASIPAGEDAFTRAVGAFVASRRIARLATEAAAELAQAEGLVTHLTSLVLVDEAGAVQEGLPVQRKVPLPVPAVAMAAAPRAVRPGASADMARERSVEALACAPAMARAPSPGLVMSAPPPTSAKRAGGRVGASIDIPRFLRRTLDGLMPEPAAPHPSAGAIDWGFHGRQLAKGDLSGLSEPMRALIMARAASPEVIEASRAHKRSPILMAIAMAAAEAALAGDRSAARVVRAILGFDAPKRLQGLTRPDVELRP